MSEPRDLVMGIVENYTFEQLRPFVVSLRNSGYRGDVVLFHQRVDRATLAQLNAHGIQTVAYRTLPGIFPHGRLRRAAALAMRAYHTVKWPFYRHLYHLFLHSVRVRFRLYQRYLAQHGQRYRHVLLTDTRDVLFQADPFSDLPKGDILFFEESFPIALSSTAGWLQRHLGQAVHDRLASHITICSGTTIGTPDALSWYCTQYLERMLGARRQDLHNGDQALHNALVYEGLEDMPFSARRCPNGEGPVYTLTRRMDPGQFAWSTDGALLGTSGRPTPIVHQYDRHPQIMERLLRRFAA